jgi:hypothetical protein
MKTFLIIGAIVIIAFILKACMPGSNSDDDVSRPSDSSKPTDLKENDKLIVIKNVTHQDIGQVLIKFCNIYNKEDYAAQPRLFQINPTTYVVTFPYDIDFDLFCFAVNFLKYPIDIKWNAEVRAWATTKQGDPWITEKSVNKTVMLYLADDDKEYDNVFLTTQDNIGYKLGFAMGEEKQLLNTAKESYLEPDLSYTNLKDLKFEDFY